MVFADECGEGEAVFPVRCILVCIAPKAKGRRWVFRGDEIATSDCLVLANGTPGFVCAPIAPPFVAKETGTRRVAEPLSG